MHVYLYKLQYFQCCLNIEKRQGRGGKTIDVTHSRRVPFHWQLCPKSLLNCVILYLYIRKHTHGMLFTERAYSKTHRPRSVLRGFSIFENTQGIVRAYLYILNGVDCLFGAINFQNYINKMCCAYTIDIRLRAH